MLYFLVILIPFIVMILYMASLQRTLRSKYNGLVHEVKSMATTTIGTDTACAQLTQEWIITDENIKELEKCMHELQSRIEMDKFPTVANIFMTKKKKLTRLEESMESIKKFKLQD